MGKEESIIPSVIILSIFSAIEAIIGFTHHNAHIIRDFLTSGLMITSMLISYRAIQLSRRKRNHEYNFGYRRMNILAAFINMVFIICKSLFGFLDTLHHVCEHWEFELHEDNHG